MAGLDRRSARQKASADPIARYLGVLQAQVMNVFWERESASVREVLDELNRRRRNKLAYTTVLTLVTRLWQRHLLDREPDGRGFRYRSVADRDTVLIELSDQLIDQLLDDFGDLAVARLGQRLEDLRPRRLRA